MYSSWMVKNPSTGFGSVNQGKVEVARGSSILLHRSLSSQYSRGTRGENPLDRDFTSGCEH